VHVKITMLHPNCVHCRPANFSVSIGAAPAANIIVADMEAARVSSPSCHTVVVTIATLPCSAHWQTCSFACLCLYVPRLSEASVLYKSTVAEPLHRLSPTFSLLCCHVMMWLCAMLCSHMWTYWTLCYLSQLILLQCLYQPLGQVQMGQLALQRSI